MPYQPHISRALLVIAEAWQAEPHPVARQALYDVLIRAQPPALRDLLSAVWASGARGFAWEGEWRGKAQGGAPNMTRLRALGLVRMVGGPGHARWYAVGAMERP